MIRPPQGGALEPLASASLRRRFPRLADALDAQLMRAHLQETLFEGTGLGVDECRLPKAEVKDRACWLQYPVRIRTSGGELEDALVLGTMFSDRAEAARFERSVLAPQAARLPSPPWPAPRPTGTLDALGLALSLFPVNAQLPTLVDAVDPYRIRALLASTSGISRHATVASVELVRFRRTRGCVLRYRLSDGDGIIYGKVGTASAAAAPEVVRDALVALSARSLSLGRSIQLPSVLGYSRELDLTLITGIPGSRPDLRAEPELHSMVDGAAEVAAMVHGSDLTEGRVRDFEFELARAKDSVGRISEDAPNLAGWLMTIIESLTESARRFPAQRLSQSHGDFTPSQIVLAGSQVGVLDFDGLCQAEAAFDIGRFLAYLRMALAKAENPAGDVLAARFLDSYSGAGGQPTPKQRIQIYEVLSLVRMAAHSWQQLKPARLRLSCAVLAQQQERISPSLGAAGRR